ncbi:hypothetical protein LguiB_023402 [Lonicera macranthoides]
MRNLTPQLHELCVLIVFLLWMGLYGAIDLLKNVQVQAILGIQSSTHADFVIDIGNNAKVPIISQAISPSLSPKESPYFIRAAQCSSSQVKAIAAIVKAFSWREVVFVYVDDEYGSGVLPYLTDALLDVNTLVRYRSVLPPSAADDQILKELYKLMTMQTRVFVVHMLPNLASRFFLKVKEVGMMRKGYTWIITDGLTSLLDTLDSRAINSMQGVLGIKPYIPPSTELEDFTKRWNKRFHQENPGIETFKLNAFGLWAYDSIFALGAAIERSGATSLQHFNKPATNTRGNLTDLSSIGTSEMGPKLLPLLRNIRFKGLSGDFHIIDGQLKPSAYQIVNVVEKGAREIGFWTSEYGISNKSMPRDKHAYTASKDDLRNIIWPGKTSVIPKGWEMPTNEKRLRVGVPVKSGFSEFVKVERDPQTTEVIATGYCINVFKEVMLSLPYAVPYDLLPFEAPDGESAPSYDDLVYQVFLGPDSSCSYQKFDAVVGDLTIVANRTKFVDFTLPYTESGVSMIVPTEKDERKNAWIFMKPLTMDLWITTGVFFIFTGFVIWVLEHRVNKEFRGPPHKQIGMIFWYSFSTLVFAHREKVISNLSRFVMIVWVFVVLVLTSSYTASLTSMLTVQQLQPTVTDIHDLVKNGDFVGYQSGSFIEGLLKSMGFDESKLKIYNTSIDYDDALSEGSRNGGVAAIIDELPYLRLFLAKYCNKYAMVGPTYQTAGFGFVFPKGSPLIPDVSRAVLEVTQGDTMTRISQEWLGVEANCREQDGGAVLTSNRLTLDSFRGLFIIAAISSSTALVIYLFIFLNDNRDILASDDPILQKLYAIAKTFDEEKENLSTASKKVTETTGEVPEDIIADFSQSPAISIFYNAEGNFSHDEGFSTTEPGTPLHDSMAIAESIEEH